MKQGIAAGLMRPSIASTPLSRRRMIGLSGASVLSLIGGPAPTSAQSSQAISKSSRPMSRPSGHSEPDGSRLSRKVAKLLIFGFPGKTAGDPGVDAICGSISAGLCGGVLLLGRNISSLSQLSALTLQLRSASAGQPLHVCIDNEGGAVTRTSGATGFSDWLSAAEVTSRKWSSQEVVEYYRIRAAELGTSGVTWNLGPVVDLNTNPFNPIIGAFGRSYSPDPDTVSRFASYFVDGHHFGGLSTCLKHFPGHGSSSLDSHLELPDVSVSWSERELEPYLALVRDGKCDSIMIGHLFSNHFSDMPDWPSSLSKATVELARKELGFDGALVTDDLHMGAISNRFTEEEAAIRALAAGNDAIIFSSYKQFDPSLATRVNSAIVDAIISGRLDEGKIDMSAARLERLTTAAIHTR